MKKSKLQIRNFLITLFFRITTQLFIVLLIPFSLFAHHQQHQVFFQNTDYELHIYRIFGEEPGKTLLIIGGIQGNEPGGYLAADMYVEMSLKKGNLIVVPRANFCSILRNVRGINGDMNRKFAVVSSQDKDRLIIEKLKDLIKESDFLLNLHDGSGFYSDIWESDLRNPKRYGQSIIADCETFFSKKNNSTFDLGRMARNVCANVNTRIKDRNHHFQFNNHRTSSADTLHREQRKSATYFALKQYEIPAFGIETSKNISSPRQRVRYQTMVINAFMDEFGIIPEHPRIAMPDPYMKYMITSVNDNSPTVVYNGEKLYMEKGGTINIIHAEANYERGITANIIGVGSYNDMRKKHAIHRETDIIIKKDNLKCGKVSIAFKEPLEEKIPPKTMVKYLILQVNDKRIALSPGEHQKVNRGDILVVKELITSPSNDEAMKVNFKGFIGNTLYNDGEDRGYRIHTAKDLMIRFSQNRMGKTYNIVASKNGESTAEFFIDIID